MALEDAGNEVDHAFARRDLRGLSFESPFAGATSFLRRRYAHDTGGADLAVLGVPFDAAVTNRPGARFGPRAIREASTLQPGDPPFGWPFDPLSDCAIVDAGDLAFDYADVAAFPARLEARAAAIIGTGAALLSLGGDHSVTLPLMRAHAARHGRLGVVHVDAHSDLWQDDAPARIDHGTFLWKAMQEGITDPARTVQIGIRTAGPSWPGVTQIPARAVHEGGVAAVVARVRAVVGAGPVYLTFDIDALDPAFAPGTGTPVWGGLASWQAAAMLRDLAGLNVVGADVVEVSPPYDPAGVTAVAAAHVATDLMCLMLWRRAGGAP